MRISNQAELNKSVEAKYNAVEKQDKGEESKKEKKIATAATYEPKKNVVLSDEELQVALESVLAAQSDPLDVAQANEMISKANANILAKADESVLAQANQSESVVAELTK